MLYPGIPAPGKDEKSMIVSVVRCAFLYLLVITAMRIMGKRQIGELEPSELVVAIMISELAAVPMQEPGMPILMGIAPILTLVALEILMSVLQLKSVRIRKFVCGVPSILVERGNILQKELRRNRFTIDELTETLREQGVVDIATVQYAILESNGKLSVLLHPEHRPMPAGPQNTPDPGLPSIVISDGHILANNLERLNLPKSWLDKTLRERGAKSPGEVFLLMADEAGGIYYLPKEQYRSAGKD